MKGNAPASEHVHFESPERFLAGLDPTATAGVIEAAADIALVIDGGVIQDVALGSEDLARERYHQAWRGRPWVDTVTVESRPKIEDLLHADPASRRWRQVNHPSSGGLDIPIRYVSVDVAGADRIVAIGRDLRSVSALQQRLVEAHQSLERDYSRLREAEARYELLFRSVSQPLLIVGTADQSIEEVNAAAAGVLDRPIDEILRSPLETYVAHGSRAAVARAIGDALSIGQGSAPKIELVHGVRCDLEASAFRYGGASRLIVRLALESPGAAAPDLGRHDQMMGILEALPDALVVAGPDLRILAANPAFVEMAHLTSPAQTVGSHLPEFLGRSGTDVNVLISNLKNHGAVRNFTTILRDRFGHEEEVEVSAVTAPMRDSTVYGLSIRSVARRLRSGPRIGEELPSSVDQLTQLVGRVPLKQIVRESTDFIEKLCIEAALEITDDNRASAAEMLGLSRQGLYSKLKRFGFDD